ncbi:MAG: LCP family protein [Oscillospiraceae bacterium]|nr:LCP family protein [Oscillospiraceae bacterium]
MNEYTNKGRKWKKPALISLIVVLALILAVVLAMLIGWKYFVNKLGSAVENETVSIIPPEHEDFETDPPITTQKPTTVPTEGTEPTVETQPTEPTTQPPATEPPPPTRPDFDWPEVEKLQSDDVINILLVGKDASSADGRPRTDSMIVVSINKATNSLSMVSLMRDLYVQIPGGYSDNRINAAYRFGGIELLNATIEKNFGIVIDGNVEVDFRQFEKIIDILGGVDIELTAAEARYLSQFGYYGTLEPGMNHLDGKTALEYCRTRQIDSDHKRTERQRKLLLTVAAKAQGMSATQVWEVINSVLPYVRTDMSESELFDVITAGIQALLSGNGIKSGKVPQSGQYYGATIMGMQVMVPNLYQCNQYLKAFIYG